MRVAGIDIGTNTILMLIADVGNDGVITPVADFHAIARLGEGLNQTGQISAVGLQRAVRILQDYKKEVLKFNVEWVFCVGTSALRDAKNSDEVLSAIENQTGFKVEVIDGELEAYLSFLGTVSDDFHSVLLDIGGGSTEIIIGEKGNILFRKSFNIGAVRFTEKYIPSHPPTEQQIEAIKEECKESFSFVDKDQVYGNVYAVAGTPTTIVAVLLGLKDYDREKVDNYHLTLAEIKKAKELFLTHSLEEIVEKLFVPPLRADVITAGTIILETFCEYFNLPYVIVSDKGLRYGIVKYYSSKLFSK